MDLEEDYSTYKNFKRVSIPPDNTRAYIVKDKKLGTGSYAETYVAISENNPDLILACKIIEKERLIKKLINSDNPQMKKEQILKALANELHVGMNLQHEKIVLFYDFSETVNNYYFFMEYCSKGTLEQLMREKIEFTEAEAVHIFKQLASGCKYLFDKNVFHRDLKPANVLLNKDNEVKLADFGFCKKVEDSANKDNKYNHTRVGTPYYMAPQILAGKPYGIKCDVWSLGIIFFELLTSQKPWYVDPSAPAELLLDKIMTNPVTFPISSNISNTVKVLNQNML